MVTDQQVRKLMSEITKGRCIGVAAAKAGMDEKTARKWLRAGEVPSACPTEHTWRTRTDVFAEAWELIEPFLDNNPALEAKTLFEYLQREYPGHFADGQLRTLQRRVKLWRATCGPGKEVFFPQEHKPGELCASDFTWLTSLGVTIAGQPFEHMLYHFVLPYSNWETGSVCFSESFEALSEGLQNALFELGGVPKKHRSDRLTAAVINLRKSQPSPVPSKQEARAEFTRRYEDLLAHYGLTPTRTQAHSPNENGDAEQRHHRLKRAITQSLLLRGSPDFSDRPAYQTWLGELFRQLNCGRQERFQEEVALLRPLPPRRLETRRTLIARVSSFSTVHVLSNIYSVPSRLIGEQVKLRLGAETIEVRFGQHLVETLPRLRGQGRHRIDYRHVIDWLVRKPGAFANYCYRADLFPTSRFRMAYDQLLDRCPALAHREYLSILALAAGEGEARVDEALGLALGEAEPLTAALVKQIVQSPERIEPATQVHIDAVDLSAYDLLLNRPDQEVR
jgi:hypothetical protein